MTLNDIKQAINNGKKVYYRSTSYRVIKDSLGQWFICGPSGYCIGLTWADGVTLNGKPEDFFMEGAKQ